MRVWKPVEPATSTGARRSRLRTTSVGALVALGMLALGGAQTASAQAYGYGPGPGDGLPPFAVRRIMQSRGFRVLAPPFRRGDVYVVDAIDGEGRQLRVIVDAYEGTIVRSFGVRERAFPPNRAPVVGERLPFPGEESRGGRFGPAPRETDEGGGLFGFFSRPTRDPNPPVPPGRINGEPRVITGIGPDVPRPPRHVVRPKPAAPRAVVRAAPAPLPGPQSIPVATNTRVPDDPNPPTGKIVPAPPPRAPAAIVRTDVPPAPKPNEARVPPAPKPSEARAPATPKSEPRAASTPGPNDAQSTAKPKPVADKSAGERQASGKATPQNVGAAKKPKGPLNDIPPAPLE